MHLLFEEDGGFKTGTILADNTTSLQVETASGKRSKVKAANVLLQFNAPAPTELLPQSERLAAELETEFLWECSGEDEFSFADFARDYYGHVASPEEATAVLLHLHGAPIYFHRKGKGRFRKAPPDILQAALAGLEKKRLQAETIERIAVALEHGELPGEVAAAMPDILFRPDRNRLETKGLEAACERTRESTAALLLRCGAFPSPYGYHLGKFVFDQFADGADFPALTLPADAKSARSLPLAEANAFSIDDAETTEVDDAFSVQELPGVGWRVGIHIAAPGLSIHADDHFGALARTRLSTVYMPGHKITMLPADLVDACTLAEGRVCAALSLYLTVSETLEIVEHSSCIEKIRIAANLRHHNLEPLFNAQTLSAGLPDFEFRDELHLLWRLALACEARRGKPSARQGLHDYSFRVDGDVSEITADVGNCRVHIKERQRGSPLDLLVSELMIVANSTWGELLHDKQIPGLYRTQSMGKVRMSTQAAPHEGLGVNQYAWCTSPLRRFTDLLNQWQLIACIEGTPAPFAAKSEALFSAMRDFELAYAAYAEFQRGLERYWCLRWLQQEGFVGSGSLRAVALRREGMFRLDHLPLVVAVPSAPALEAGAAILVEITSVNELTLELDARYKSSLDESTGVEDDVTEDLA